MTLTFIVGQTGVGKSTTLKALDESRLELLPNRRELTDELIIPEMQRLKGEPLSQISDRLKRFELTALYRETYKTGMIHALGHYLKAQDELKNKDLVFDNIRGLEECKGATETFAGARFIFLYAPAFVRLKRLLGRQDSFDKVSATRLENTAFIENLQAIKGAAQTFDLYEVARFEANSGLSDSTILDAVSILSAEHENYNAEAAASYLQAHCDSKRLLYLDTGKLGIIEVAKAIQNWL